MVQIMPKDFGCNHTTAEDDEDDFDFIRATLPP